MKLIHLLFLRGGGRYLRKYNTLYPRSKSVLYEGISGTGMDRSQVETYERSFLFISVVEGLSRLVNRTSHSKIFKDKAKVKSCEGPLDNKYGTIVLGVL